MIWMLICPPSAPSSSRRPAHCFTKPAVSEQAAETGSDHSAAGAPLLPHLHCRLALSELCLGAFWSPTGAVQRLELLLPHKGPWSRGAPSNPLLSAWRLRQYLRRAPDVSTARCTARLVAPCTVDVRRSATACAQGLSAAMRHARRHANSAGPHAQLEAATCRYLPGGAATHTSLSLKPLLPDH